MPRDRFSVSNLAHLLAAPSHATPKQANEPNKEFMNNMRIKPIILLILILLGQGLAAQELLDEEREFIKQNTIVFEQDIESTSVSDFNTLNFNDSIVVFGLGEANHGTLEFQILKLKLAEYLIHEKGLNTIMIEFPFSQGLLLDDYVKGQNQDGLKILTNQKNSEYKNTEFINFIDAIKKLNEERGEENKISFLGGDIFGKPTAIKLLKEYFSIVDTTQLEIFANYQELEIKTYLGASAQDKKVFTKLSKKVSKVLSKNRVEYIRESSLTEYNRAIRLSKSLGIKWKGNQRAVSFANNVLQTLSENSKNKILVIGHNRHIGMLNNDVGALLKRKLGDQYLSIGTDYEEGTFSLWNLKDPNNRFVDTLYTPTLDIGFAHKFSTLPGNFSYISFESVEKYNSSWTTKENYIASIGMGFNSDLTPTDFRPKVIATKYFDGLFIFKRIHPSNRFE